MKTHAQVQAWIESMYGKITIRESQSFGCVVAAIGVLGGTVIGFGTTAEDATADLYVRLHAQPNRVADAPIPTSIADSVCRRATNAGR
jgi:hypothetical protein